MDKRVKKLIEFCDFEEDASAWEEIFSKLFNRLTYTNLCNWHRNRDKLVRELIFSKDARKYEYRVTLDDYFSRESDGRIFSKEPLLFETPFSDNLSRVVIYATPENPVFIGEGVELVDSTIRASAFIGNHSKILNSRIFSSMDVSGEANYVGVGVTLEDLNQFCKSVVGSSIPNSRHGFSYIHADAINGGIIGGSARISDGVGFQSHWTRPEETRLIDILNKVVCLNLTHPEKKKTPSVIGCGCRIGAGVQIISPLILEARQDINTKGDNTRLVLTGLVSGGKYYSPQRTSNGDYNVVQYTLD